MKKLINKINWVYTLAISVAVLAIGYIAYDIVRANNWTTYIWAGIFGVIAIYMLIETIGNKLYEEDNSLEEEDL